MDSIENANLRTPGVATDDPNKWDDNGRVTYTKTVLFDPVTGTPIVGGGGTTDVSALSKEATQLLIKTLLQGTLNVNTGNVDPATGARQSTGNTTLGGILSALQAALPLPTGAATDTKLEAVRSLLAGTLAVNTGNADPSTGARQTANTDKLELIRLLLAGTLSVNPGTAERRAVVFQQTLDLSAGTAVALPAAPNGATSLQIQPQGADIRLNVAGGTPTATSGLLFGQDGIYDLYLLTGVKLIGAVAAAGVQAELVWRA